MIDETGLDECVGVYRDNRHRLGMFLNTVRDFFLTHPALSGSAPIVHSVKSRLKDEDHLRRRIVRKWSDENPVTKDNLLQRVTDLAGVRVLHLHQQQFVDIFSVIAEQLKSNDWVLYEPPVAYTWDPESRKFFEDLGLETKVKESFYTSIHYVVKPRTDSPLCCEIQIRTLFEEIWGEIDHSINYPEPSEIVACREQLRVLAKFVGTGSRLADSIFRTLKASEAETGNASVGQ